MNELSFFYPLGQLCLIAGAHRLGNTNCFMIPFPVTSNVFPAIPVWRVEKSQHGNCVGVLEKHLSCNCNALVFQPGQTKQILF